MKQRIYLGLAPLFVLLLAMGIYAVALFAKLGNQVDVILRENFRSVLAGQQMKETAERMDSALFFALAGEAEKGRQLYGPSQQSFQKSLNVELGNITLPGEAELAARLQQAHQIYTAQADAFWSQTDLEMRRRMYFDQILPASTRVKDLAHEVVQINQRAMLQADRQARDLAGQSRRYMALATIGGLTGAIFFAAHLTRSILQPIRTLTAVSKELGDGKLDQVVPVQSKDELGQLADTFNKMATKLRSYRQAMGDRVLQAQQMTEITFSAFPDPIIALSADGHIDFKNPAANRFLAQVGEKEGLPAIVQKEADQVLHGACDYLPSSFEKVLVFRVEDHEVFMLPRVIGMRSEAGNLFGAAIILQDVTRLRLMDEVKTNLVSTVSHELKTPLTSVRMGLHLLLEERIGTLNSKQTELLLAAREDSERLLRMINDLLDLAKLEAGQVVQPRQPISPRQLVDSISEELEKIVEVRGLRLAVDLPETLPKVSVDASQIAHVFSNFVSNAAKHSKAGEEVALKVKEQNGSVRFSVIDRGCGIPAQYHGQIFDRFFRVPGADVNGAGLGLAIAREIVQAHGGSIGVQSISGQGSEFFFDLPPSKAGGII